MTLPVADAPTVRRYVRELLREHRGLLTRTVLWFALATACGLAVPALIGDLVDGIEDGVTATRVNVTMALVAGFLLLQCVLTRVARLLGARLGERILADIREGFVDRVLTLPLSVVERAGTGDLLTRSSRDVDGLSLAVRTAAPSILVSSLSVLLTAVALVLVSPLMALPCLLAAPVLVLSTRWYLRRARAAYLAEAASYSDLTQGLAESMAGARTVAALGLGGHRMERVETDIARSREAERRTLFLRSVWYPLMDFGYVLPAATTLLAGGVFYLNGWVGLGQVTAAVLYTRALVDPLDELLSWLDELQIGDASLARLIGVNEGLTDEPTEPVATDGHHIAATGVRYAYRPEHEVLHGVDLDIRPGERIAIVGASGAGKSTLGRLLAGIHPPLAGSVRLGGVPLDQLPLAQRRGEIALVTQEHHLFLGSVRDNVALGAEASDAEVAAALDVVFALDWVRALPEGLDTELGADGLDLPPARAQQIALARLVLANPHTLVLDEATSLLDPRAARRLEQSMAAVLADRTVIAIAHRLHTARDADRVVVMENGRVREHGSHDELLAREGRYAALWEAWHGRAPRARSGG
ncbi:ABC transporter ATP-binding protein [Streptomyces sp. NBRC 109706]|uniref:ABC transporter ATP-binding protein n=1 Tax=Streptomyces sp. NBRC 109706 TaxID=1550035 RepID=UPI000784CE89|nr:ABC transporter ATP-binding protein [Streptomyces sp. NBRC 109706]